MSFTSPGIAWAGAAPVPWRPSPRLAADIKSAILASLSSPGTISIRATGSPSTRICWARVLYFIIRSAMVDRVSANVLWLALLQCESDAAVTLHAKTPPLTPHLAGCLHQVIEPHVLATVKGRLACHYIRFPDLGEREPLHLRGRRLRCQWIEPPGAQALQVLLAQGRRGCRKQSNAVETAWPF